MKAPKEKGNKIMKYITNRRINVRTIRKIENEGGLTLRNGKIVEYKTGWQVGIKGIECRTPESPPSSIATWVVLETSASG